jgi:hypothetical protein
MTDFQDFKGISDKKHKKSGATKSAFPRFLEQWQHGEPKTHDLDVEDGMDR